MMAVVALGMWVVYMMTTKVPWMKVLGFTSSQDHLEL